MSDPVQQNQQRNPAETLAETPAGNGSASVRQPYPSAPNDEEVGDEGVVQSDAGDNSFLIDLPVAGNTTATPPDGAAAPGQAPASSATPPAPAGT